MSLVYDEGLERLWRAVMISALKEGLYVRGYNWSKADKEQYGKNTAVKINKAEGVDIRYSRDYIYTREFDEVSQTIGTNQAHIRTVYNELLKYTLEAEVKPSQELLDKVKIKINLFKINNYTFS